MTPQPGTAGTDDDPLDSIETEQLVVNGEVIDTLVGLAFDSASASDGVLRFDGTGSTNGITDGSAKVLVNGTVYDVAGGEWVDFSGTSHTLDSWEKVVNSQFDVTITGVSPYPVNPGNTLDVTADVTNSGTDSDTQTVTLDIDNGVGQVDSASVTLSGGGSSTQTLSWSVPSGQTEQDYTATVASNDDTASQTVTVSSTPASLVSRWTFDDADTNSGTAVDVVGSNDGTISGATTGVSGANQTYTTNEAYSFDGAGDNVDVPDGFSSLFDGNTDATFACWVRVDSNADSVAHLFAADGKRQSYFQSRTRNATGPGIQVWNGSSNYIIATGNSKVGDGWFHYVGVFDSGADTMRVFIDGAQKASGTLPSAYSLNNSSKIAERGDKGNHHGGEIDDVRVYDKALTSTEVSNLYNNGRI